MVMLATQLGLTFSLSKVAHIPERDILMQDFTMENTYYMPSAGLTSIGAPSHKFHDFRYSDFAPLAFRYFRNFFGIDTQGFMNSMCANPMKELSRSGASGSLFFKSSDDLYVLKTVDKREAIFLQRLLPGYYMVRG